jgi:four helix bundle protein
VATIQRFEDLLAWQKARSLSKEIYLLTSKGRFARDFALCNQIRRASISVFSNIAEGFERGGNREFQQFLAAAKGSTGEVRAQLYLALDLLYIDVQQWSLLNDATIQTSSMISGLISYLAKKPELRGARFKILHPRNE